VGPFLPKSRKNLGFPGPNTSPLGTLVNAYRRADKGTKCLSAPNEIAKAYATLFKKGVRDYLDDALWWKAAQEEDQKQNTGGARSTPVNTGTTPSDDINTYLRTSNGESIPASQDTTTATPVTPMDASVTPATPAPVPSETSRFDELIQRSTLVRQLSGKHYKFGPTALNVRAYELNKGDILVQGERKPCFFSSDGIDCDFVYNPTHPLLAQYPITPKILLLQYLSEKLKARDNLPDVVSVFATLVEQTMSEAKIDRQSLQDRAAGAFDLLRDKLAIALKPHAKEVLDCVHESVGEVEETINQIQNATLIAAFQSRSVDGYDAIYFVPPKTLVRLVEKFPDYVFDGKVLSTPYSIINFSDENAARRSREESKERAISFIKDALRIIVGYNKRNQKNELSRASLSVDVLLKELGA
jgi:hypothetical protein